MLNKREKMLLGIINELVNDKDGDQSPQVVDILQKSNAKLSSDNHTLVQAIQIHKNGANAYEHSEKDKILYNTLDKLLEKKQ
jgi:hypothetical protein